jgi:hypothetical protein
LKLCDTQELRANKTRERGFSTTTDICLRNHKHANIIVQVVKRLNYTLDIINNTKILITNQLGCHKTKTGILKEKKI